MKKQPPHKQIKAIDAEIARLQQTLPNLELKEQAGKTLDRMLDFLGLDNRVAHDFGKRNSYINQLIKKQLKKEVK